MSSYFEEEVIHYAFYILAFVIARLVIRDIINRRK